jgi:hypothetical protein
METQDNHDSNLPRHAGGGREAHSSGPRTQEASCLRSHGFAAAHRDSKAPHANVPRSKMHMQTRLLEQVSLRVLPWWKGCQRDRRTPRPAAPVLVLSRSCFLESPGVLPPRCIAIKRDGTRCVLRCSFQPQPANSTRLHSEGAIVFRNEAQIEVQNGVRNKGPDSRRSDCAPGSSNPRGLSRPIEKLFSLCSTTGLEDSLKVPRVLPWGDANRARPAACCALSGKAPRTRACMAYSRTKPRSRKKGRIRPRFAATGAGLSTC